MTRERFRRWLFLVLALAGTLAGLAMWSNRISLRRTLMRLQWWEAFQVVSRVHNLIPYPLVQGLQLTLGLACLVLFVWLLTQPHQRPIPIGKSAHPR